MAAKPKLTPEEWNHARKIWEADERKGFPWLIEELDLPVSAEAVRLRAKNDGWVKTSIGSNGVDQIISFIGKNERYKKQLVYIVTANEYQGIYKIGITKNVSERISGMQTGCPYRLYAHKTYVVNDALTVEIMLHSFFQKKRLMGEWFELSELDLKYIDEALINIDDVLTRSESGCYGTTN